MTLDRTQFEELFRDLLNRLHDYPALEKHPLGQWIGDSAGGLSRGEQLRQFILQEINGLRPNTGAISENEPKQRPYLILYKRYVEGRNPASIANELFIGERQMRRDHNKALDGLAERFWNHHILPRLKTAPPEQAGEEEPENAPFAGQAQALDLQQIVQGVAETLQKRFENEETRLEAALLPQPRRVLADRVILRQAIIGLLNLALQLQTGGAVRISSEIQEQRAHLSISYEVDSSWEELRAEEMQRLQKSVLDWLPALQARLQEIQPAPSSSGEYELRLQLPLSPVRTILVVDDQAPTVRMFQRYLSQTAYEVTGIQDPQQAIPEAIRIQPFAITLDVMMPNVDGWELLQALKLDPQTHSIPVIICSALDAPELARSLGAASFLKKPIVQKDLLAVLAAFENPAPQLERPGG